MEAAGRSLKLVVTEGETEREFIVDKSQVSVGRALSNEVVLTDIKASRSHARFDWDGSRVSVTDLGSRNGTFVNGSRVETAELAAGDSVQLGDTRVRIEVAGAPETQIESFTPSLEDDVLQTMIAPATIAVALNDTSVPRLAIQALGETWEVQLDKEMVSIGRGDANDIVIQSNAVSRQHAQVQRRRDGFYIVDLGSTNGTRHEGRRIEEHRLNDGDEFQVGPAQIVFKDAFRPADLQNETRIGLPAQMPTVIFVPGIMGSELWSGSERVWPNVKLFLSRGMAIRYPSNLEARALVDQVVLVPGLFKMDIYGRLGDYLVDGLGYERGRDLFDFPYDWRQDNRETAKQLAAAIDAWDIKGPIVIVAHSMGCLISRYYIEHLGGKRRIQRLIQLGGPLRGSVKSIDMLMTGKGMTPMGFGADDFRKTISTFPSMYQLLPSIDCVYDVEGTKINVLEEESWVAPEHVPLLRSARDFHRELPQKSSVSAICVFGYGLKTTTEVRLQRRRDGSWQRLSVAREASGDTVVPEASATLPGSEIHPVRQPHGTLFLDNDVKMRLKIELTKPF